jgi:photosystem II stability/assembly factor-like uncharacterized protein
MRYIIRMVLLLVILIGVTNILAQWIPTPLTEICASLAPKQDGSSAPLYAGTLTGVYSSLDHGENWNLVWGGQGDTLVYALAVSNPYIFAGTFHGGVVRSRNGGQTWNAVNNGITSSHIRALAILTDGAGDTTLFAGTFGGGIFRSTDLGSSWGPSINGVSNLYIMAFTILNNGSPTARIFAASNGGGIYASDDGGMSWQTKNNGLLSLDVRAFTFSKNSSNTTYLFASTHNGGVFLSTDAGDNWTAVNNGLTSLYIWSLASLTNSQDQVTIFAGSDQGGVYRSTNSGSSWELYNLGQPPYAVTPALAIREPYVFAGTWDAGVWRRLIDETTFLPGEGDYTNPQVFHLGQNYPNPFNPVTQIRYAIPQASRMTLEVYNSLGQKIAELVNEEKAAGQFVVAFDASQLPSGIYIYRINAGSYQKVMKMILMK